MTNKTKVGTGLIVVSYIVFAIGVKLLANI